jgi:hypothetical protein
VTIIDTNHIFVEKKMKRRSDATYVADLPPFKRILPYAMPKRCDAVVYHEFTVDLTEGIRFIKKLNRNDPGDHTYRVFELFLSALLRTITVRPHLNRFIMNYDCWQRNELSLNFVVKEDYTDEAPEHTAILYFEPDMTFPEIASIINRTIEESRNGGDGNDTDSAIGFFLHFPKWVLRSLLAIIRFFDVIGLAPKALRDADGLHASAFVANLGSINLSGSPHHHLYEWGTTSLFLTMGMLKRKRMVDEEGNQTHMDTMQIGVSVDERIADGFYFIKSMQILQDHLSHPELLMQRPQIPALPPSAKEVAKKHRIKRKVRRKRRRFLRKSA